MCRADNVEAYVYRAMTNTATSWRRRRSWAEYSVERVPETAAVELTPYDDQLLSALRALPRQNRPSEVVVPGLLEGLTNVARRVAPIAFGQEYASRVAACNVSLSSPKGGEGRGEEAVISSISPRSNSLPTRSSRKNALSVFHAEHNRRPARPGRRVAAEPRPVA